MFTKDEASKYNGYLRENKNRWEVLNYVINAKDNDRSVAKGSTS